MTWLEAIADGVRMRIVRHLAQGRHATVADLAEAAGAHPNTVRSHLAKLEELDVVQVVRARAPRGRPPLRFRLAEGWVLPTTDHRGLAELLAAFLARLDPDPATASKAGRDWGRFLLGRPGNVDVGTQLPRVLERLGFDARVADDRVELTACPCPLVAPERPELICTLAAGVCDGVLAACDSGHRVGGRTHRPSERSCTLALEAVRP